MLRKVVDSMVGRKIEDQICFIRNVCTQCLETALSINFNKQIWLLLVAELPLLRVLKEPSVSGA